MMRQLLCFAFLMLAVAPQARAFEVRGQVLDMAQHPIAEAFVWLTQDRQARRVITDKEGGFLFEEAGVGPGELVAWKEGRSVAAQSTFLAQDWVQNLYLEGTASLSMRIIDQTFHPAEGVRLRSLTLNGAAVLSIEDLTPLGFPLNRSNAEGQLEIPWLPPNGFVQLNLAHYRYADTRIAYLPIGRPCPDVMMHAGFPLKGQVRFNDKGVADARVVLYAFTKSGLREWGEVKSDPEGFFTLRAPEGEYGLAAKHPEYASPKPQAVILNEASSKELVLISLADPLHIYGRVRYPDQRPCPGTQVIYRYEGAIFAETWTDPEGRFHLQVASSDGAISLFPPEGYLTEVLSDIPVRMGKKREAHLSDIFLKALPEIVGIVLDPQGKPAPNALVSSLDLIEPVWTITDAEGKFRILLRTPPEEHKQHFRVEHATRFLRNDFEVNLRKPQGLQLTLAPFEPDHKPIPAIPGRNNLDSLLGKAAPELQCQDWFNTPPFDAATYAGKVLILYFWGSFDLSMYGVSRLEELRAHAELLRQVEDICFLGIHDAGNEADEIEAFLHAHAISFPVGRDTDDFSTFLRYGINFIPQCVLIDKEGIVRYYNTDGRLLELIKVLRRKG